MIGITNMDMTGRLSEQCGQGRENNKKAASAALVRWWFLGRGVGRRDRHHWNGRRVLGTRRPADAAKRCRARKGDGPGDSV